MLIRASTEFAAAQRAIRAGIRCERHRSSPASWPRFERARLTKTSANAAMADTSPSSAIVGELLKPARSTPRSTAINVTRSPSSRVNRSCSSRPDDGGDVLVLCRQRAQHKRPGHSAHRVMEGPGQYEPLVAIAQGEVGTVVGERHLCQQRTHFQQRRDSARSRAARHIVSAVRQHRHRSRSRNRSTAIKRTSDKSWLRWASRRKPAECSRPSELSSTIRSDERSAAILEAGCRTTSVACWTPRPRWVNVMLSMILPSRYSGACRLG